MGNPGSVGGVGGAPLEGLEGLPEVGDSGGSGGSTVEEHDHARALEERPRAFLSRSASEAAMRGRLEEMLGDDAEAEGTDGADRAGAATGPDPAEVRSGAEAGARAALRSAASGYRGADRDNARAWLDSLGEPLQQQLDRICDPRPGQPRTAFLDLEDIDPPDLGERLADALNREYDRADPPVPIHAAWSGDRLTLTSSMEGARTDIDL